jgi:MOSC domain-containing protein YiiM
MSSTTLFLDLEAGDLAIGDLAVDTIRPRTWQECRDFAAKWIEIQKAEFKRLGIAGDERADMSVHGGLDKAVYLYPHEHYAFWVTARERILRRQEPLSFGVMGENLTTEGLLETELWVGDRLEIGKLVLEVTEPRAPCYKFAARMGYPQAIRHMLQSGFTGVYLKVITPADIAAGERIHVLPGSREVSIASINGQRLRGRQRDLFP